VNITISKYLLIFFKNPSAPGLILNYPSLSLISSKWIKVSSKSKTKVYF